jgi:hypothetical protein
MSTYTPISSVTISSALSSVTFAGVPQTYTDLILVIRGATTTGTGNMGLRFNSDSSTSYSQLRILGDGTSASTERQAGQSSAGVGDWGTDQATLFINIMNYAETTMRKTVLSRSNTTGFSIAYSSLWSNTSAITTITALKEDGNNFTTGTTFNLYGIADAEITNVAKATGGNSVYTDGTYWYHTFFSSGVFTPKQNLTCDYLVVAGGGGGGANAGGGGGAGGLRSTVTATGGGGSLESALSLTAQAYAVTIGGGGTRGSTNGSTTPSNGSNSVFSTITSIGGGYGINPNANGIAGGSGGGAAGSGSNTGGARTVNQGFAGGGSSFGFVAGGGGGAGAVGGSSSSGVSGNGGAGVATSISGTSVTYAGGGGGGLESGGTAGTGGAGGGGNGSGANGNGVAGTNNTGGGGGGGSNGSAVFGGNGGSGIVIVRYAV